MTVVRGVTHLEITTPPTTVTSAAAMNGILSLLAHACPVLQKLQVNTDIGRPVLADFGAFCPKLFSLKVIPTASGDTLQQLHLIIPRLTHCSCGHAQRIRSYKPGVAHMLIDDPKVVAICKALLSCSSLTHMDFGALTLTLEMWYALPPGLQGLHCSLPRSPPVDLHNLGQLQQLELYCTGGQGIDLSILLSTLRLAPKLRSLQVSDSDWKRDNTHNVRGASRNCARVFVPCTAESIPDLICLHNLVLAGLALSSSSKTGGNFAGVIFTLRDCAEGEENIMYRNGEENNMHYDGEDRNDDPTDAWNVHLLDKLPLLLKLIPPFPGFNGLEVINQRVPSPKPRPYAQHIAAKFPNLEFLRINSIYIYNNDLLWLRACTALKHLVLVDARITDVALGLLCSCLLSLNVVDISSSDSSYVSEENIDLLQRQLQAHGSKVKLSFNH